MCAVSRCRTAWGGAFLRRGPPTRGVALVQEKVALGHDGPGDRARFAPRHKPVIDATFPNPVLARCDIRSPRSSRTRSRGMPTGPRSGANPSPSRPTTPSLSGAAAMAWPRPTTWPRSTASRTSRCWKRATSARATSAATPPSSAPTTCCPATRRSTNGRSSSGRAWSRTSTTTPWCRSAACSTCSTPTDSATPSPAAAMPCA